jgi:hypothetical protein
MAYHPAAPADPARRAQLQAELRREKLQREKGYRTQALKLFPHVCGSCGREFEGRRLKELTVHHKDHDHTNNPTDGSNWELLCIYCHDHEHEKHKMAGYQLSDKPQKEKKEGLGNPFESLDSLFGG